MYIDPLCLVKGLFYGILGITTMVALILLIIFIFKATKTITRVNSILNKNETNINELLASLPKTSQNLAAFSQNMKEVGEVVTEATATAIDTKESLEEYATFTRDILLILKKVFFK